MTRRSYWPSSLRATGAALSSAVPELVYGGASQADPGGGTSSVQPGAGIIEQGTDNALRSCNSLAFLYTIHCSLSHAFSLLLTRLCHGCIEGWELGGGKARSSWWTL